jgi:hypothetical protein
MNTTTAAIQANVTADTIRTWCRIGAIAAVKQAGRWIIDTASLAARIAIGAMKRRPKPVIYSVQTMTAIGGNRWQKAGKDRVYLNNWAHFAGIETSNYGTGNIASASYQGESISNSQAYKLLGSIDKVWYDATDGKLHCRFGYGESRVASQDELWTAIVTGVRAAIAAI